MNRTYSMYGWVIAGWVCLFAALPAARGSEGDSVGPFAPIVREYCVDCHSHDGAEANVNLEQLIATPNFSTRFRIWEKISEMLRAKRMPPEDMPQPSGAEREQLVEAIRQQLHSIAVQKAGDPGRVVMRRLTSAEYAYTIRDLTSLELSLESILIGDAVGGEGFTNVGDVQFVQDSTLERYLEAAKLVAAHAVIGSGPLRFFEAPGKTGLELSAIRRIQEIYRQHGFRTAAGEGGEPFGLDLYPRAFFVAWRFHHRQSLGMPDVALADLAAREGLSSRFVEHVWAVLHRSHATFPLSEIIMAWWELPPPSARDEIQVREECDQIALLLRSWQARLARNAGDDEEAALLTEDSIRLAPRRSFRANIDWEVGAERAAVHFIAASATGQSVEQARVIWRNPTIQFRRQDRRRTRPVSLVKILPQESKHRELFGNREEATQAGEADLVLRGDTEVIVEFEVPTGARGARLSVEAELLTELASDSIVRCTVRDGSALQDTAADTGEVSMILGRPQGAAFETWKAGVLDFAKALPDVSHREPAPSDRDPIPPPFDNTYNNPERNDFHYSIKYHRDDHFLVDHILDDAARRNLDHAWNDLLSSFDYHDTYLAFIAQKSGHDLQGKEIASLRPEWIASLPDESRAIAGDLAANYHEIQAALRAAQSGHLEDVLRFAQSAWRRPLTLEEKNRLRDFYMRMRETERLEHVPAIRALLARVLVAPAFLYRVERAPTTADIVPLSSWELASRLSYFLWSSPPDAELLQVAQHGELDDKEELARQTRRMLRDPKARRFAAEFFGQWFGFYRFGQYTGIDAQRFPEFDDRLKSSMHEEAVTFFSHIVRENRPVEEILFASYAHWNRDLASHYGLPSARLAELSSEIQLIEGVTPLHRGGLLGLGVVHVSTSAPLRTSAVKRGDWILRRVLGTPVPPPPADAGSIAADDVAADGKTIRERLVAHRREAACVNCHSRMDPLGFAMENFDPIGRWRDHYRDGQAIDSSGTLHDGTPLHGFDGLQDYLREQLPKFHRTLCSKLLGYALGRGEILSDKLLIETMMDDLEGGASISKIATRIVTSPQFRTRRGGTASDSLVGDVHGIH